MKKVTKLTKIYGNWRDGERNIICNSGLREFMNVPRGILDMTMTITDKKPKGDTDYYEVKYAGNCVDIRTPVDGGQWYYPGTYTGFDNAVYKALKYNLGYIYFHYSS